MKKYSTIQYDLRTTRNVFDLNSRLSSVSWHILTSGVWSALAKPLYTATYADVQWTETQATTATAATAVVYH